MDSLASASAEWKYHESRGFEGLRAMHKIEIWCPMFYQRTVGRRETISSLPTYNTFLWVVFFHMSLQKNTSYEVFFLCYAGPLIMPSF